MLVLLPLIHIRTEGEKRERLCLENTPHNESQLSDIYVLIIATSINIVFQKHYFILSFCAILIVLKLINNYIPKAFVKINKIDKDRWLYKMIPLIGLLIAMIEKSGKWI